MFVQGCVPSVLLLLVPAAAPPATSLPATALLPEGQLRIFGSPRLLFDVGSGSKKYVTTYVSYVKSYVICDTQAMFIVSMA